MLVLGVSFDSVEKNRAFAEKFQFPFPLLSDPDRKVALAYGACEDPKAGSPKRITYVIGKHGKIEHAIETRDPAGQAQDLLDLLSRP